MSKLESMSFRKDFVLPVEEQDRMLGFIKWGKKNDYPYFLVDLYNGSAWHQGIIKNKTHYIAGGGIEVVSGELSRFLANSYTDFTMDEIVEQLAFDYELFGSFAVKGTWNKEGTRVAMWEHLPVDAIRISSDERMYYLSDDWTVQQQSAEKTNLRTLPALDENNKTGSFVLYYKDPAKKARKEHGVYPKPPYQGGITAIQTDCDISKFHMYELQNGFKSGTMITFMDGFPETQEEAESFKNQIKGPASNIENSGDIIITFAPSSDQAPKVENLTGNDLDKRYDMLQSSVQQNILVAHSVVAPSLFGVAPEGSFNAAESAELFEIFKKTYVDTRQKRIEWILNYMVKLSGDVGVLKLKDVKPIGINETAPAQPVAQETTFNRQDINALMDVVSKMNDGKISSESALTIIMTTYPHIDEAQARKIVGINTNIQQSHNCQFNNDTDEIGYFAEHGDPASNFDTVMTISIPWNTPMDEVFKKHDELFATIGQVTVSGEGSKGLGKNEGGSQFEVRYSYRTIPGIPPVKTESRAFCVRLLQLNRIYTRDEIQTISTKIGRDVWRYRGGWYTNPETKKTTPWCRHEWVQQLVIAKAGTKDVEVVEPQVKTNEIKIATVKDGKIVAVETFEKNTDIKISKVKMSKDMTVEKMQKYLTELNKLTSEYRIENALSNQIELGFQSTSKTYGFVRSTVLDSKIVQINLGHRTDLTSRNPNKRAFVDERGILKLQHKSSVDQENIEVATVTHEMAHVFALKQSRNPKIQNYFSKLREIYREYNDEVFYAKQKIDVKTLEKIYLGQYAQTNLNEFHAEAFTEYRLNSNPSLYAKKVGKLFDSIFKK